MENNAVEVKTRYDLSLFERVTNNRWFRAPDTIYFGISRQLKVNMPDIIVSRLKADNTTVDLYVSKNGEVILIKPSDSGMFNISKNKKTDGYVMYCSNMRHVFEAKKIKRPTRYKLEWIEKDQMWAGKIIKGNLDDE